MNKREKLDRLPLDAQHLHKLLRRLFPKANDYAPFGGSEVVQEFHHLGVRSRKQARLLLKRHRRRVIHIDREPVDEVHERLYSEEFGENFMRRFERTRVWFTYAGLARLALELEFGDRCCEFADQRDGIQVSPQQEIGK